MTISLEKIECYKQNTNLIGTYDFTSKLLMCSDINTIKYYSINVMGHLPYFKPYMHIVPELTIS